MLVSFVSTGRKDITKDQVVLQVTGIKPLKVAMRFNFASIPEVKPEHELVIAANRRTRTERRVLGKVGEIEKSQTLVFERYVDAQGVSFDVRVVDTVTRKLIARGEAMTAKSMADDSAEESSDQSKGTKKKSVMYVQIADENEIGALFWKVDFSDPRAPVLLLNNHKFGFGDEAKDSPFFPLAMAEAVRQCLVYAFIHEGVSGSFPNWAKNWLVYTRKNLGVEGGPDEPPPSAKVSEYVPSTLQWIDECCSSFAEHLHFMSFDIKKGGAK